MQRLGTLLALSAIAAIGGASATAAAPQPPSRPHNVRTLVNLSGDEYHDAQNNLLKNPRGTKCSSAPGARAPTGCWTWEAKNLGHGTYTLTQPSLRGGHLVWTFTYTDARGGALTGDLVERFIPDPSPSDALTHANRYPATYTITGGTGRFSGVTGLLTATTTKITVDVDPSSGTAHSRFAAKAVGTITFPP